MPEARCHSYAIHDPETGRWQDDCPQDVLPMLETPVRFQRHEDRDIPALKLHGIDARGRCCYYRRQYVLRDEQLDDEDLPILVETFREQVTGWRLPDGRWLRHSWRLSGRPDCGRRVEQQLTVVARADDLER